MTINIAIIPARYGSKRIKRKNIINFFSKPIIKWTFETLQRSKIFSKIIVSTESEKIIKVCKKIGIKFFIRRPKKLSGDFVGLQEVIEHSIKNLDKKIKFDNVCCILPCNPFLEIRTLKKALKIVKKNKKNYVNTITKFKHPPEQSYIIRNNKELVQTNRLNHLKMTQTFKTKYHDLGQFYFASQHAWLKKNSRKRYGVELPNWSTIDIDDKQDLKYAKILFQLKKLKKI